MKLLQPAKKTEDISKSKDITDEIALKVSHLLSQKLTKETNEEVHTDVTDKSNLSQINMSSLCDLNTSFGNIIQEAESEVVENNPESHVTKQDLTVRYF